MKPMDKTSSTSINTLEQAEFLTRFKNIHDAGQLSFEEQYSQVKLQECVRLPLIW
jgi:hypothetical protein